MILILLFFVAHWYLSLFSQTFLHHRYASHAAFTMSKFWERVFYLFAYITQGSSYLSPRVYAIMHRMHHAYTDTDKDPHSPKYDKNLFIMMWRARLMTSAIFNNCLHYNEPGCAIKQAVVDQVIHEDRYISYLGILDSIEEKSY